MTNAEWKELVAKEFGVSKAVAKDMVSAMHSVYNCKKGKIKLYWIASDKCYKDGINDDNT